MLNVHAGIVVAALLLTPLQSAPAGRLTFTPQDGWHTRPAVSSTPVAEVRPGATERFNKPGLRMRTAIITTPAGPYFVKMLGPDKPMTKWGPSLTAWLETVRFER